MDAAGVVVIIWSHVNSELKILMRGSAAHRSEISGARCRVAMMRRVAPNLQGHLIYGIWRWWVCGVSPTRQKQEIGNQRQKPTIWTTRNKGADVPAANARRVFVVAACRAVFCQAVAKGTPRKGSRRNPPFPHRGRLFMGCRTWRIPRRNNRWWVKRARDLGYLIETI